MTPKSSAVIMAIGIAMMPSLLLVESQLGVYLGGILQQGVLAYVVFLPVTARRGKAKTGQRRLQGEALVVPTR